MNYLNLMKRIKKIFEANSLRKNRRLKWLKEKDKLSTLSLKNKKPNGNYLT